MIKQLSIFVQNTPGRLAQSIEFLANANIDIRALSLADTTDFGILRLIVNNTDLAYKVLKDNNRIVNITPVVAASLDNQPGGLSKITKLLSDNGYDIQYMYAFVGSSNAGAYVVLKVENPEEVTEFLKKNNIECLSDDDVSSL